jgi:hypothetical protein
MIKFFRKIRQNLLSQGKTGRYFKYAIGEIILVVIGILIALQINNWNEERKVASIQLKYLKLLKSEVESNIKYLDLELGYIENLLNAQKEVFRLIDSPKDTLSEMHVSKVFFTAFSTIISLNHTNNAFTEIKSSGELKNIENDSLRTMLINLDSFMDIIRLQEKNTYNAQIKILDLLGDKGDFRSIIQNIGINKELDIDKTERESRGNKFFLDLGHFENEMIFYITVTTNLKNDLYSKLRKNLVDILNKIEEEIKAN